MDLDPRNASATRDTDAAIARLLFGWRWMRCPERGHVSLYPPEGPGVLWHIRGDAEDVSERYLEFPRFADWDRMGDWRGYRTLPRFTSDVAATLGWVWDALIENGWQLSLVSRPYANLGEQWVVNGVRLLDGTTGHIQRMSVRGPDRCLALCRFALTQAQNPFGATAPVSPGERA